MGFDSNGIRLLIKAKQLSVNFERVLTIGRQGLHLEGKHLQKLLSAAGYDSRPFENTKRGDYAESFLKAMGASNVDSMDASDYEGATLIHDLNLAVPEVHQSKYSLVIDGGSLEHIFNFPMAIKNCMEMIQVGGHYIGITPTNNFLGHGFYQFSPELYFRIFNKVNGFELLKMYFYINKEGASIYEVKDPDLVRQRVTLVNSDSSYLFIIAKKIEQKNIFEQYPMQSDYEKILWENKNYNAATSRNKIFAFLAALIPSTIKNWIKTNMVKQRPIGLGNPEFFKKIDDVI